MTKRESMCKDPISVMYTISSFFHCCDNLCSRPHLHTVYPFLGIDIPPEKYARNPSRFRAMPNTSSLKRRTSVFHLSKSSGKSSVVMIQIVRIIGLFCSRAAGQSPGIALFCSHGGRETQDDRLRSSVVRPLAILPQESVEADDEP